MNRNVRLLTLLATVTLLQGCSSPFAAQQLPSVTPGTVNAAITKDSIWSVPSSRLDLTRLPLGDTKFTTTGPQKGYVYACDAGMYTFSQIIGAQVTGPWVDQTHHTFDVTAKVFYQGNVLHNGELSVTISGGDRVFTGNGLPIGIPTSVFPVLSTDPGYQYDPNPNAITPQAISFAVPANPTVASQPFCTYKRIGITLDGVELDAPLDSSGRDENGYELNDICGGKPQPGGSYHRQFVSGCMPHILEKNKLVGYALDGFGIFSPFDASGNEIVSADLDECHGTTSPIEWDGRIVNMYHYVLTRDFPYTITCFRGQPNYSAFPALPPPPGGGGGSGPGPSGGGTGGTYNFPLDCSVFLTDQTQALAYIAGETKTQCQNDLNMLNQLYQQFQNKSCDQMKQIFASITNGQQLPPPPAPGSHAFQALAACAL